MARPRARRSELSWSTAPQSLTLAERTERRIRRIVAAFEAELAQRLADIDAQAQQVASPHALNAGELAALDRAVGALVHELTGARP